MTIPEADRRILEGLLAKDERSLECFLRQITPGILIVMWRRVRSCAAPEELQDLMQEVALRVWNNPERFDVLRPDTTLAKWANQIAKGVANEYVKKAVRRSRLLERRSDAFLHLQPSPEDQIVADIDRRRMESILEESIRRLSAHDEQVLRLFLAGKDNVEISGMLGVTTQVVRTRLSRARKRLGAEMMKDRLSLHQ